MVNMSLSLSYCINTCAKRSIITSITPTSRILGEYEIRLVEPKLSQRPKRMYLHYAFHHLLCRPSHAPRRIANASSTHKVESKSVPSTAILTPAEPAQTLILSVMSAHRVPTPRPSACKQPLYRKRQSAFSHLPLGEDNLLTIGLIGKTSLSKLPGCHCQNGQG